jgi:chemotaxis protein methyltransferase CheR
MASFREYNDFLFSPAGLSEELGQLIDAITTNTTEFFREPKHFEILRDRVLPGWLRAHAMNRNYGCGAPDAPPGRSRIPWPWF